MSVTITRRQALELGDQAIEMVRNQHRGSVRMYPDTVLGPAAVALRKVLSEATVVARGGHWQGDIECPMMQASPECRQDLNGLTDVAYALAIAWDTVTHEDGLSYGGNGIIHINPLT